MAEFKPMVKMYTDEPSVSLKLKKGGHVSKKAHDHKEHGHGHKPMQTHAHAMHMAMEAEHGHSPKKPSMSERRKSMNPNQYKKGGKVQHKLDGGMMAPQGAAPQAMSAMGRPALAAMTPQARAIRAAQVRRALMGMKKGGSTNAECKKLERELHHHEALDMKHAHHKKHGGKMHKAEGGSTGTEIDEAETRTTLKNSVKPYAKTKMHDGDHHDKVHGTGEVKEGQPGGYKHGGKVHHISGHPEGSHEHHKHMAKHYAKMHKEGGSAHHKKMHEHHKAMCSGGKYATGGSIPSGTDNKENRGKIEFGGTIEDNEHDYENTEMHTAKADKGQKTTGGVRMSNAGGFKHGGKMHHKADGGSMKKYEITSKGGSSYGTYSGKNPKDAFMKMLSKSGDSKNYGEPHVGTEDDWHITEKPAKVQRKADGGAIDKYDVRDTVEGGNWENRPADTSKPGKTNTKTGEVKEANGGGYKHGGHASKKHYATGGNVVDDGKAVKMPKHFVSRPVANSLQSGTFKKGGKVKKHYADGDSVEDMSNGAYDRSRELERKENEGDRQAMYDAAMYIPRKLRDMGHEFMTGVRMVGSDLGLNEAPKTKLTDAEKANRQQGSQQAISPGGMFAPSRKRGGRA